MKKKPDGKKVIANGRAVLDRISDAIRIELSQRTVPEHGLKVWDVTKWLAYQLHKLDAIDMVRDEIEELIKHRRAIDRRKGPRVPRYAGMARNSWVQRAEALGQLEDSWDELMTRTMEYERSDSEDLAMDCREAYYDVEVWECGKKYDPDYEVPIIQWANIEMPEWRKIK